MCSRILSKYMLKPYFYCLMRVWYHWRSCQVQVVKGRGLGFVRSPRWWAKVLFEPWFGADGIFLFGQIMARSGSLWGQVVQGLSKRGVRLVRVCVVSHVGPVVVWLGPLIKAGRKLQILAWIRFLDVTVGGCAWVLGNWLDGSRGSSRVLRRSGRGWHGLGPRLAWVWGRAEGWVSWDWRLLLCSRLRAMFWGSVWVLYGLVMSC